MKTAMMRVTAGRAAASAAPYTRASAAVLTVRGPTIRAGQESGHRMDADHGGDLMTS